MNPVNRILISRRDFKTDEELYAKVGQQVRLLLEAGYTLVLRDEDEKGGEITIDFKHTESDLRPFWLTKQEMTAALNEHMNKEIADAKNVVGAADKADNFLKKLGFDFSDPGDDGNNGGGLPDA